MSLTAEVRKSLIASGVASIPLPPSGDSERDVSIKRARETLYRAGRTAGLKVRAFESTECMYGFARRDS